MNIYDEEQTLQSDENESLTDDSQAEASEEIFEEADEDVNSLKERLAKAEEIAKNQRLRAEKAEKLAKGKPEVKKTLKNEPDLSLKDILALKDVAEDDIDEVLEYAQYKKLSPAEALKSSQLKTILQVKAEERRMAQAANTGVPKRGGSSNTDQSILNKLSKGELPTSDAELARAAELRVEQKRKNK